MEDIKEEHELGEEVARIGDEVTRCWIGKERCLIRQCCRYASLRLTSIVIDHVCTRMIRWAWRWVAMSAPGDAVVQ